MTSKVLSILLALAGLAPLAAAAQDAAAGAAKAQMCIGCHGIVGYQASFPQVHKVPMISGQSADYIASSLNAYRKGDRRHPTMRSIASSLTDKDIADLAAYYAGHVPANAKPAPDAQPAPSTAVAGLLAKGACSSCHGANYSKPISPAYPKLAGQYADYLYVSLKAYGDRATPQVGRNNAIMAGQVKPYSHAELKAMADYLGSLQGELATVPESRFRWGSVAGAGR